MLDPNKLGVNVNGVPGPASDKLLEYVTVLAALVPVAVNSGALVFVWALNEGAGVAPATTAPKLSAPAAESETVPVSVAVTGILRPVDPLTLTLTFTVPVYVPTV